MAIDKSLVELRLLLSVSKKPDLENPRVDNWRDWDIANVGRTLEEGLELFRLPEYNRTLPTVFVIHGLRGTAVTHSVHLIAMLMSGYTERFNIVALDVPYFKFSSCPPWYLAPAVSSKLVGEAMGEFLAEAVSEGLVSPGQVHVVGYSLGAHSAGYMARTVPGTVATIVGLDPAGPGYNTKWGIKFDLTHVSESDAPVVHVYHTSSRSLGSSKRIAKVDVIFNNGWLQPGCKATKIVCSHKRAMLVFAEMIRRPAQFEARRCNSKQLFQSCKCQDGGILHLTFPPDPNANGKYYLETSGESPYGKGHFGALCTEERRRLLFNSTFSEQHESLSDMFGKWRMHIYLDRQLLKKTQTEYKTQKGRKIRIDHAAKICHWVTKPTNCFESKTHLRETEKNKNDTEEEEASSLQKIRKICCFWSNRLMKIPSSENRSKHSFNSENLTIMEH